MLSKVRNGAADVLGLDIIDIAMFQTEELIAPVTLREEDFLPRTLVASRLGRLDTASGEYWAVPYSTDVGMLFTRGPAPLGAQSASGSPLSFVVDNLVPPGSGQFVGQLMPLSEATNEAFVVNVLEQALARDTRVLTENGVPSGELEVWQGAFAPLQAAIASQRISRASSEDETRERFRQQSLTYMRNWPVQYRRLQQDQDADVQTARMQVTGLPIGILGGQSLAIVRGSGNEAEAQGFIDFMTSETAQKILASYGVAATATAAYSDPNLRAFIPHLENVRGAVERAHLRRVHQNYAAFSEVVARNVGALLDRGQVLGTQFIEQLTNTLH